MVMTKIYESNYSELFMFHFIISILNSYTKIIIPLTLIKIVSTTNAKRCWLGVMVSNFSDFPSLLSFALEVKK